MAICRRKNRDLLPRNAATAIRRLRQYAGAKIRNLLVRQLHQLASAMLEYCTQWLRNARVLLPMAGNTNVAPNAGSAPLRYHTQYLTA